MPNTFPFASMVILPFSPDRGVTTYAHDPAGRLTRLTYPSGTLVEYAYTQGRISRITVNGQVLLDHIGYAPFGPAQTWTWGNGQTYARSYEANGWIKQYPVANLNRTLTYDPAGRITAYRHPGQANLDQTFSYNAIDQLNGTTTYQGSQGYRYDNNGNRTQQLSGSNTYAYAYPPGNNRLQSVAGPVPKAYQYDAAGNITSDGQGLSYSYDDLGRLRGMSQRKQTGDVITTKAMGYTYDGLGQRFMKGGNAAGVIFYAYDETGRLLSEQNVGNVASQDTIWLDDLPVGVVKQGQLHYIHADHLHTPRAILDPQNRPRWRWDNADPFGVGQPDENPSGLGRFVYNPRFPGQVYDAESGLHYNYFRDGYEPRTGRYTQGDPIGLAGGVNLYLYANAAPTLFTDPLGLAPPMRTYNGGNSAQNRYARRHPQLPPNIPRLPENDNASEAAGYYNDEGQYVCLRWSCEPKPDGGQCGAGYDPRGNVRSANDYLPAATDPNNPPPGCTCDEQRFRPTGRPGAKGLEDYLDAGVRGYRRFGR